MQQSLGNLNRTAAAIAAQQAAQAAARQAAGNAAPAVPDGLAAGGLQIDTQALTRGWTHAEAPKSSTENGRSTVTINQTADRAILNWQTFNVGRDTTVDFRQQAEWAVLNRVNDPAGRPSQIQGQIKAPGTVLIVNRNGVVFDGASQVNVRNLVAAAGRISDEQFRERGLYGAQGSEPSFTDALGKVEVRPGARIDTHAPGSVTQGGGYAAGAAGAQRRRDQRAPRGRRSRRRQLHHPARRGHREHPVDHAGQRDRAAPGGEPGWRPGTQHRPDRGGRGRRDAGRTPGAPGRRGAGRPPRTRGTIHLLNSASDAKGSIVLAPESVTAVLIDDDGSTALDSQRNALIKESAEQDLLRHRQAPGAFDNLSRLSDRRDQSRIEIVSGGDIQFQGGSLALATGGQIAATAARRGFAQGAELDVAGAVGVRIAMASNNVKINVQGNELRDAPNRDAAKLFNGELWVDRRSLIPVAAGVGGYEGERWYTAGGLLEVGGYLANLGHGIGEWAAQGRHGDAGRQSGGAGGLADEPGRRHAGRGRGVINLSWLRGADGRLYEASSAPADRVYAGLYRGYEDLHGRWGEKATRRFLNPVLAPSTRREAGFTVGRDAGRLVLSAPTAVVESEIVATVYDGARQTQARAAGTDGYGQSQLAVARAGGLALGNYGALGRVNVFNTDVRLGRYADITLAMAAGDALAAERVGTLWLDSARLSDMGLGVLDLATGGALTVARWWRWPTAGTRR